MMPVGNPVLKKKSSRRSRRPTFCWTPSRGSRRWKCAFIARETHSPEASRLRSDSLEVRPGNRSAGPLIYCIANIAEGGVCECVCVWRH